MNYLIKPMVALTSLMSFGMVHADTGAGTAPAGRCRQVQGVQAHRL